MLTALVSAPVRAQPRLPPAPASEPAQPEQSVPTESDSAPAPSDEPVPHPVAEPADSQDPALSRETASDPSPAAPGATPAAQQPPSALPPTTGAAEAGKQTADPTQPVGRERSPDEEPEKKKKKKKEKSKWTLAAEGKLGQFRVKGRVFVRGVFQSEEREVVGADGAPRQEDVSSFDFLIRSARLGVKYRAPAKWLRVEAEAEMRKGRVEIRDAHIEAKGRTFSAQAGNFKVPVSIIEYDSAWDVPVAERGSIRDILRNWLDVARRRPGVAASWHPKVKPKPSLIVGLFQGSEMVSLDPGDRDTELLWKQEGFSQSVAARAGLDLGDVEFGAFYEYRVGSPELFETDHYWTAGGDVTVDLDTPSGGLRLWLDGMAGASWYEHSGKPPDEADATFLLTRLIVGYRFGGHEDEELYVEPFAMGGLFEPDTGVTADLMAEAAVGVNVGLWERARVALEGEWSRVARNWPEGLATAVPPKRVAVVLQASVRF